mmetsp:Transcript_36541/g.92282  ORF Transcript_36541/g.92282 Transcript_36541/m.92282 type:complete len:305 (-) Transcript_36541:1128-2042(-)
MLGHGQRACRFNKSQPFQPVPPCQDPGPSLPWPHPSDAHLCIVGRHRCSGPRGRGLLHHRPVGCGRGGGGGAACRVARAAGRLREVLAHERLKVGAADLGAADHGGQVGAHAHDVVNVVRAAHQACVEAVGRAGAVAGAPPKLRAAHVGQRPKVGRGAQDHHLLVQVVVGVVVLGEGEGRRVHQLVLERPQVGQRVDAPAHELRAHVHHVHALAVHGRRAHHAAQHGGQAHAARPQRASGRPLGEPAHPDVGGAALAVALPCRPRLLLHVQEGLRAATVDAADAVHVHGVLHRHDAMNVCNTQA